VDTNNGTHALHLFLSFKVALWSIVELLSDVYFLNKWQHPHKQFDAQCCFLIYTYFQGIRGERKHGKIGTKRIPVIKSHKKANFFEGQVINGLRVGKCKTTIPRDISVLKWNTSQRTKNRQHTSMKDSFQFQCVNAKRHFRQS